MSTPTNKERFAGFKRRMDERNEAVRRELDASPAATMSWTATIGDDDTDVDSVSVSHDRQLLVLHRHVDHNAAPPSAEHREAGRWRYPNSGSDTPYPADLIVHTSGTQTSIKIPDLPLTRPVVQPLPDGQWLAVSRHARFNNGAPDHNAVVLDATGAIVRSFCIGTSVGHVQTSPSGAIWVGHRDEGIFATWRTPDGDANPGRAGIVCWSPLGTKTWDYAPPPEAGPVYDCYSLNVAAETVWSSYYAGFPVVRVDPDRTVSSWPSGESVHALAVHENRIALIGGNSGAHDRILLYEFGDSALTKVATIRLELPDGARIPDNSIAQTPAWKVEARGNVIHAVADNNWFTLDIANLNG